MRPSCELIKVYKQYKRNDMKLCLVTVTLLVLAFYLSNIPSACIL